MHADFDLGDDEEVSDLAGFRRGFHRPEGGRPPGYSPKKARAEQRRQEARAADPTADDVDDVDDLGLPFPTYSALRLKDQARLVSRTASPVTGQATARAARVGRAPTAAR